MFCYQFKSQQLILIMPKRFVQIIISNRKINFCSRLLVALLPVKVSMERGSRTQMQTRVEARSNLKDLFSRNQNRSNAGEKLGTSKRKKNTLQKTQEET